MSDTEEKDKTNLIPLANQRLAIRASNLVRRGLEYLRAKEVTPLPVLTEDAAETVSSFNKDDYLSAGQRVIERRLLNLMHRAPPDRANDIPKPTNSLQLLTHLGRVKN